MHLHTMLLTSQNITKRRVTSRLGGVLKTGKTNGLGSMIFANLQGFSPWAPFVPLSKLSVSRRLMSFFWWRQSCFEIQSILIYLAVKKKGTNLGLCRFYLCNVVHSKYFGRSRISNPKPPSTNTEACPCGIQSQQSYRHTVIPSKFQFLGTHSL